LEEAKLLNVEDIRKNYSPFYVSRGVSGWGCDRKEILDLMGKIFPEFNLPSIHLWK